MFTAPVSGPIHGTVTLLGTGAGQSWTVPRAVTSFSVLACAKGGNAGAATGFVGNPVNKASAVGGGGGAEIIEATSVPCVEGQVISFVDDGGSLVTNLTHPTLGAIAIQWGFDGADGGALAGGDGGDGGGTNFGTGGAGGDAANNGVAGGAAGSNTTDNATWSGVTITRQPGGGGGGGAVADTTGGGAGGASGAAGTAAGPSFNPYGGGAGAFRSAFGVSVDGFGGFGTGGTGGPSTCKIVF
jgi:hypothetical protein